MDILTKILKGFEFQGIGDFLCSLAPSLKYTDMTFLTVMASSLGLCIDVYFGMTGIAMFAFVLVMVGELVTGVWASVVKSRPFESHRLSRFSLKMACYLLILFVSYQMSISYQEHDVGLARDIFQWLHVYLVVHFVVENIISILENMGTITGKGKQFWIRRIQEKVNEL